jgi:hypothetical protein
VYSAALAVALALDSHRINSRMPIPDDWPAHARNRAAQFLALWKYYRFSRTLSESAVPYVERHAAGEELSTDDVLRGNALVGYWMASLCVLVEGWERLGLDDAAVSPLLTKHHLQTLQRYRHTMFHFQPSLDAPRILALEEDPKAIRWVFDIGEAFQHYFEPHGEAIHAERIRDWLFAPPEAEQAG